MVFSSKTFKKNRTKRKVRKNRKTVRKQRGGYVPYRRDPPGVKADVMDWDDQKELVEPA